MAALLPVESDARSIDDLGLSARTLNCLKRAHLTTVGQVLAKNKRDLLSIRNFGDKSLTELEDRLKTFGYLPADLPEDYLLAADDTLPLGVVAHQALVGLLDEVPEREDTEEEDTEGEYLLDSELEDAELERSL